MKQGLKDRELGFERGSVAGAEGGAVSGVVVGLEARGGERGEAGGTAAVHSEGCGGWLWMVEGCAAGLRSVSQGAGSRVCRMNNRSGVYQGSFGQYPNYVKCLDGDEVKAATPRWDSGRGDGRCARGARSWANCTLEQRNVQQNQTRHQATRKSTLILHA